MFLFLRENVGLISQKQNYSLLIQPVLRCLAPGNQQAVLPPDLPILTRLDEQLNFDDAQFSMEQTPMVPEAS